jgi:signal transduction histidine kinase
MNRSDEFGRVGATFDAMADHVCRFLDTQKELLANVSHELRTPIARLRVALDLASEGDPSALASFLEGMQGDLDEIDQLLRDILTVARLDIGSSTRMTGAPSIDFSPVTLSELVTSAVHRFRLVHERRQIVLDIQDGLPPIQADGVLLHRVVANLLDNAHKYSSIERPITVRVRQTEQDISVSIRDRGSGIVSTDTSHVFVPFFRVDRSRNRRSGGFGLGLALAKRIVEAHGGSIDLRSGHNLGTTVTFTIPVFRPSAVE